MYVLIFNEKVVKFYIITLNLNYVFDVIKEK